MEKAALILEGGAMRSLFTSGVLDVFMENNIEFSYVIGVSAGALTGANYISKDIGRSARINITFADDKRFIGFNNLVEKRSLFNFDFLFNDIPRLMIPMNCDEFSNSKMRFVAVATDSRTGLPAYFENGKCDDMLLAVRASGSIPFIAPPVEIGGKRYFDGGVSDAIPYKKAIAEGYDRLVLVLTRDEKYRAAEPRGAKRRFIDQAISVYPGMRGAVEGMPDRYNSTLAGIRELEAAGKIFVIRPQRRVTVRRAERDADKLGRLYLEGKDTARSDLKAMLEYIRG